MSPASAPVPAPAAAVGVAGVTKVFRGGNVTGLGAVDLDVPAGRFVSIIGPSGCGKSTLLRILAGLDSPTTGAITWNGEGARDLLGRSAFMPQSDALLPFRRVVDNVALGLAASGVARREARAAALPLLERSNLAAFAHAYPAQLSGGMRQRAAFLRTVIAHRPVLLLDEPFGALDSVTRQQMQSWLLSVWEAQRSTVVMVTHDVAEAVYLSDLVYVLSDRPGRVREAVEITLPRPRSAEAVESAEFGALEARLRRALRLAMSDDAAAAGGQG
jgi:ABC-type nitrate/sulfonate/bicarbonate transport system ATPase subunit